MTKKAKREVRMQNFINQKGIFRDCNPCKNILLATSTLCSGKGGVKTMINVPEYHNFASLAAIELNL